MLASGLASPAQAGIPRSPSADRQPREVFSRPGFPSRDCARLPVGSRTMTVSPSSNARTGSFSTIEEAAGRRLGKDSECGVGTVESIEMGPPAEPASPRSWTVPSGVRTSARDSYAGRLRRGLPIGPERAQKPANPPGRSESPVKNGGRRDTHAASRGSSGALMARSEAAALAGRAPSV